MTKELEKAVKILLDDKETSGDDFLSSMALLEEKLTDQEWSTLKSMTLLDILKSLTLSDFIVFTKLTKE